MKENEHERLSSFLNQESTVIFAYLFGSCARNSESNLSDVDIAVYFSDTVDFFSNRLILYEKTQTIIGSRSLDLIVLNDCSLLMQYEVIRDGIVLKEDTNKRIEFETNALRLYLDTERFRAIHVKAIKNSFCTEGTLGQ